MRPREIVPVR